MKSLRSTMNELKDVTNNRLSDVNKKFDNIIETYNKVNLKG